MRKTANTWRFLSSNSPRSRNMNKSVMQKPNYGNWVSLKFVLVPGIISLVFWGLALLFPFLAVVGVLFCLIALYFAYAYYRFSQAGDDIQSRVQDLVLEHLDWNGKGKVLDIGCGNGPLSIKLAKKYSQTQIEGIDFWGNSWAYCKSVCDQNVAIRRKIIDYSRR
jgi:hypothetical protein